MSTSKLCFAFSLALAGTFPSGGPAHAQCFGPIGCAQFQPLKRHELLQLDCRVLEGIRSQIFIQNHVNGTLDPKSMQGRNAGLVGEIERIKGCRY